MEGQTLRCRYNILKKLGSGGFGDTYLAKDLDWPGKPLRVVKHLQQKDPQVYAIAKKLFDEEAVSLSELGQYEQIPICFGETITDNLANYNSNDSYALEPKTGNKKNQTTIVGSYKPNGFGLYDMHGNVWEWCLDDYHSSYHGAPTDETFWQDRNNRKILRGGSWLNLPDSCRSATRNRLKPGDSGSNLGFRLVCYEDNSFSTAWIKR